MQNKAAELVSNMKTVSEHIFTKTKGNALAGEEFAAFVSENEIKECLVQKLNDVMGGQNGRLCFQNS